MVAAGTRASQTNYFALSVNLAAGLWIQTVEIARVGRTTYK
jgi:hypothetical protein